MISINFILSILVVIVFYFQDVDGTVLNSAPSSFYKLRIRNSEDPAYTKPSSLPSRLPSSAPSSPMPTSCPSTSSPSISLQPSAQFTAGPTNQPSLKTDFPTNLPTYTFSSAEPTSTPSTVPTTAPAMPSSPPSSVPSISPSNTPTSYPTKHTDHPSGQPSNQPTGVPSSLPTLLPSLAPTPKGEAGKDWWYTLTSEITLTSFVADTFSDDDLQSIIDSLNYAFLFEYSDSLTISESESITVVVDSLQNYQQTPLLHRRSLPYSKNSHLPLKKVSPNPSNLPSSHLEISLTATNYTASFSLKTWSPSQSIQRKLFSKTLSLQENSDPILQILHEQEFRDISNVRVTSIQSTTTTTSPPAEDSNLSPDRIIYIIIGTIVVFALGVMIVGGCVKVVAKARQPSTVQLRDIDGDVMMTTAAVASRSSPNRHSRSSSAPTVTQSPLHGSEVRGSKSNRTRKQQPEEDQFENFADFSAFEPERNIERNPMHSQQQLQNHHNRTPVTSSSLTSSSAISSSSTGMKKEEVEDVFDFRFDELLNEKASASSKYSKGLTSNDEDNTDYDLDGGEDDEYSNRRKPSSSTFSFFSTFSSHGSKGGKKKSKDKVDYESLVL